MLHTNGRRQQLSGYLALAKKSNKTPAAAESTEDLVARGQRKLAEAERRGLLIRWSEYPAWIKIHDPLSGEWHEVRASECLPGVVKTADNHRKKRGQSAS